MTPKIDNSLSPTSRAAQYVRMSTEHQQYSPQNQSDTITKYAITHNMDSYVWLCVVNLLTSAVEALSQFEFNDPTGLARFSRFVERYFGPEFRAGLQFDEPRIRNPRAVTPAEQLYRYFRSGLAHSFCIEWGGLLHREDGAPAYLFETPQGHSGQRAMGVVPRELVADFRRAVDSYFVAIVQRLPNEPEAVQFNRRFEEVFLNKARLPVPVEFPR